jgi:hypothetical protein
VIKSLNKVISLLKQSKDSKLRRMKKGKISKLTSRIKEKANSIKEVGEVVM